MTRILFAVIAAVFICSAVFSAEFKTEAPDDLKKYIPDVEAQLADGLNDIIKNQKQVLSVLKPYLKVSKDIAAFLGCPEKEDEIQQCVLSYYNDAAVIKETLSRVVLMSEADARRQKVVQKGYVNYLFSDKTDEIDIVMSAQPFYSQERLKEACLPILISADGSVCKKEELLSALAGACGVGETAPPLVFMSLVSDCMKNVTETYPYFSRWYTEGMPYLITSVLLGQYAPGQKAVYDKLFQVSEESKSIREKVNLWDFSNIKVAASAKGFDKKQDNAEIQYSCLLMQELYEKIGKKGVSNLNSEFKYDKKLNNEGMCRTIKMLFGEDFKAALLEYSPDHVKELVNKGNVNDIKKEGENAIIAHEWDKALTAYTDCLLFDQRDYNSRLNLATVYRELGDLSASDMCILICADTMDEGKATISLVDIENNDNACVVLGKYFYLQEAFPQAYGVLFSVYRDHEDWEDVGKIVKLLGSVFEKKKEE